MSGPDRESDRPRPPAPEAARRFTFPAFEIHHLDNGLGVYLARHPRGPLVHQELVLPGGAQNDVLDVAGRTSLTASVLDEGTATRTSQEIARQVDGLGGYLSSQSDWDAIGISFGSLSDHFERGLELIADIVTTASFPEHEFRRLQDQQLAQLRRRKAQPSSQAADALAELLYAGSVYSRPLLGIETSVASLTRDDLLTAAIDHTSPRAAALVMVGDIEPHRSLKAIEIAFADWTGPVRPAPTDIHPEIPTGIHIQLVDRPEAPQTELWLGHSGVPKNHPDRPGLAVLNSLLGGKFTSRINLNLRERLGITYGASSSFSQRRGPGPFIVEASVDTNAVGKAISEVLSEMRRLQDELVSDAELADTKSYLIGVFPYTLQRIEGLADRLGDLAVFDLPPSYFTDFFDRVGEVTRDDLLELARRHLHPDRVAIAVAGPRAQLEPQLRAFGELRIAPLDGPRSEPETSS